MATPKGMPEYAKGTQQAIAATKKATTPVTPKPTATPSSAKPPAAISNQAAALNSTINKYDVAKANQAAKNAQQAKTIINQIAKQTTQPQALKEAFIQASPSVFPKSITNVAPSSTPSPYVAMGESAKPSPALPPSTQPLGAQLGNLAKPVEGMPVYATGNVPAIQQYTASNVTPLTEAEKKKAFDEAVAIRQNTLENLTSSRVNQPSSASLQQQATGSVAQRIADAQQKIAGAMPMSQDFPVIPPIPFTTNAVETPSSQQPPYGALGDKAKQDAEAIAKIAQTTYGGGGDVTKTGQQPPVTKETAATTEPQTIDYQQLYKNISTPIAKEILSDVAKGQATTLAELQPQGIPAAPAPVATPVVQDQVKSTAEDAQAIARKQAVATGQTYFSPTESELAKGLKEGDSVVVDGVPYLYDATDKLFIKFENYAQRQEDKKKFAPGTEGSRSIAGMVQDVASGATVEQPKTDVAPPQPTTVPPSATTTPEKSAMTEADYQKMAEESAFAQATKQVDEQIASQNAELDKQIAQAQNNRDYQTAQNLQAFKSAMNQMRDTGFLQSQQAQQQMANRGLLTSGLASDAQVRLQMSMNQNMRDLAQKQQIASDKLAKDFQTRLDTINEKKTKLQQGRTAGIEKAGNAILKEIDAMDKVGLELQKLQVEENKNLMSNAKSVLDRLAKQGYNTAPFEAIALTGNVDALAQALQNSGEPQLSLLGGDMKATIEETKSKILLNQRNAARVAMDTKQSLSQIDKQRSEATGYVFMNGKKLKDSKGNPIPTAETIQNRAELSLDQKRVAIDKSRADTARAKANSKSSSEVRAMGQPQQLNFLQDAISALVIPKFEDSFDRDGEPIRVKVGEELNPANIGDFDEIMKDLWTSGAVNNNIIANQYRAFGLAVPKWANYPYGSVEQRDASTVDAFNNIKQQ